VEKGEVPLSLLRGKFKNVLPAIRSMEKKGIIISSDREF